LIAQRAEDQKLAGKWEFPGGKVEFGETTEECLIREIKEELGINIEVNKFFAESTYQYDTGAIKLFAYRAQWIDGEYELTAYSQIKWVKSYELENYDFAPADIPFIKKLKEELL
jgi:8-oxo-dGTP diphosphatase